jgi:hypothetical protein
MLRTVGPDTAAGGLDRLVGAGPAKGQQQQQQ